MRRLPMLMVLPGLVVLAACGGQPATAPTATPAVTSTGASPTPTPSPSPSPSPTRSPARTTTPTASPRPATTPTDEPDPRWRFYSTDHRWHTSPWFAGAHRVMIGYGCNASPWYAHDPRCPGREGFHHGIDVAMPCGTPLTSDVDGMILSPSDAGAPGPAYGVHPFRIHTGDVDILIGHTRTVLVGPGDRVRVGQRIALSSDSGAPDGCHLHFEVRRHGQGLGGAMNPAAWLKLS